MAVVDALEKQNIEEACVYLEKRYTGSEGRDPGTAFYEHLIEYHLCTYKREPVRCEPVLFF